MNGLIMKGVNVLSWKEFGIKKPRLSGITKHGCTHNIFTL